ncbi:MAG: transposase [Geobacteraceae bacterium]
MESKIKPIQDVALLLKRHDDNILLYFDIPISNEPVEGLNNKAKVISHRAYGFRAARNYILNLYHCMGTHPCLRPCTDLCEELFIFILISGSNTVGSTRKITIFRDTRNFYCVNESLSHWFQYMPASRSCEE